MTNYTIISDMKKRDVGSVVVQCNYVELNRVLDLARAEGHSEGCELPPPKLICD